MASSPEDATGAVAADRTVAADVVVPAECATWSTAVTSDTADSPEYSRATMPTSAAEAGFTVTVSALPPLGTGAVQTLISVPSAAVNWVASTKVSPSESVTELVMADCEFQTPASTTSRSPVATLAPVVTARLLLPAPCALTCCTKVGTAAASAWGAVVTAMAATPATSATAEMVHSTRRPAPSGVSASSPHIFTQAPILPIPTEVSKFPQYRTMCYMRQLGYRWDAAAALPVDGPTGIVTGSRSG